MNADEPNTVITDCRFANEVDIIRNLGGVVIHVQRGANPNWYNDILFVNQGYADQEDIDRVDMMRATGTIPHESETAWIGKTIDYRIHNDDTLDDLNTKVVEVADKIVAAQSTVCA